MSVNGIGQINDMDSRLAVDLAIEVSEVPDILKRHGITAGELRQKLENTHFRNMIKEARSTWNSDLNIKERIRLKSMVLVEDSLLELYSIFQDRNTAVPARLEAFKSMSKVATVDAPDKDAAQVGNRVSISINIPGMKPVVSNVYAGEIDGGEAITNSTPNAIANT